jgi:hypothetical protein
MSPQANIRRFKAMAAIAALCLFLGARTASADLVISAGAAYVPPGGQGLLEIDLTNTGPAPVTLTGFFFTVQAPNDNVTFSQVSQAGTAAPYIFDGNSWTALNWPMLGLSGPDDITLSSSSGPPMISANDTANDALGTTLAMNQTVALGLLTFSLSPTVPVGTSFSVSFLTDLASTNLAGPVDPITGYASLLQPDQFISGSITATPAPSTFVVAAGTLILAGLRALGKWRRTDMA